MKFSAPLVTSAILALAVPAHSLQKCSADSITPCECPYGTDYAQSATFAVIGAAAIDVKTLMSDFYNLSWSGVTPSYTQGPDNTAGSVRTFIVSPSYNFSEKLTTYRSEPRGSFIEKFELDIDTPLTSFPGSNGSFSGYWVTMQGMSVFEYETAVRWSVYACEIGHPLQFATFHEGLINTAISILQGEGKILGETLSPVSVQSF